MSEVIAEGALVGIYPRTAGPRHKVKSLAGGTPNEGLWLACSWELDRSGGSSNVGATCDYEQH